MRSITNVVSYEEESIVSPLGSSLYTEARRSIIRLVELLIEDANVSRASDVHIDPTAHSLIVRMRIDGFLLPAHEFPLAIHPELIARIKILAGLRIDEHNTPQDGRFKLLREPSAMIDLRVSITPTYYGENAVLRIFGGTIEDFSLPSLSFSSQNQKKIADALQHSHGMILATGPTGSGKTTTMYTLVRMLTVPGISTITLEDPIEYSMPGVRQIQINPKTGLTFASGLRSVLRQDPDVIMVGEIRDAESAALAIHAALTGHRLLSTLHTKDATSTITRLLDMGVEPYLVASTISVSVGQRLVRRICENCKSKCRVDDVQMTVIQKMLNQHETVERRKYFRGKGCALCKGTGYRGRMGVHEVMHITPRIRAAIHERRSSDEIKAIALSEGMVPIAHDALQKAFEGFTTLEEALKTAYE
ncbi:MAG TPA: GspE/PulE family protein [Candidatus Paceibacterota bacterium]|nr:GspE/PulE family protein [Candidatus Paceibacterota bacterium]